MKSHTKALAATVAAAAEAATYVANANKNDWRVQRQEHWQRNHLKVISCKVTLEEHAALMQHCKAAHCTRYALLRLLLVQYLNKMENA